MLPYSCSGHQGAHSFPGPPGQVQEGITFGINPRGPRGSIFPEERITNPERGPKAWVHHANLAGRKKRKNSERVSGAGCNPSPSQQKEEKLDAKWGLHQMRIQDTRYRGQDAKKSKRQQGNGGWVTACRIHAYTARLQDYTLGRCWLRRSGAGAVSLQFFALAAPPR